MEDIQRKLISKVSEINPSMGKVFEVTFAYTTVLLLTLIPNFIMAIFALYFNSMYSDEQCKGPEFISVNQYLFKYGVFTCVAFGLLFLSLISLILVFCEIVVLPTILFVIAIIVFVCYVIFLIVWFYFGIIVLIYSANCYINILPQWVLIFIIVLGLLNSSKDIKFSGNNKEN